jgi:PAS domain S-box-containing protein
MSAPVPQRGRDDRIESCLCELRPHDHLCLIYESREEQLAALVPFVRTGIERGDRCFYVADGRTVADVAPAMHAGGIDVAAEVSRGSLALATERESYLAAGEFDPDAMLAMAEGAAAQAIRAGYGSLRIAGEMTWALGDDARLERLMEYEVKVNRRIAHLPVLAVCQYDRRRFSPEVIRDVIRAHPLIAVGGRVCRNFYYVPPDDLIGPDRLHREVDRLLENIQEREQAEDALRASERRLARVLEGSNDAFWDWNVCTGEVTFSPRWREIACADDLRQGIDAWKRILHPEDLAPTWAAVVDHLEGRSDHYVAEYRVRGRAGDWRWVQARGKVVEWAPGRRPERMAGIATDVTERRTLQARLEMAGRLATVGTLVAGIAHEINNPLAYVMGNLRHLAERLEGAAPAAGGLAQAVTESLDGAERIRDVVQGLRRFAGPSAEGRRGPVDVGAEIQAAAGIVRHQVVSRARLSVDVAPGLPPVVAGLHEVGQVVVNLLVNAAQAIPEGNAARNEVKVTARAVEGRVVIEVSDTGGGIPPALLPRIFDPFFTTKQAGGGAGLGLAICHGIVSAAGGTIHVRSEPGGGAEFRVELPAAAAAETAAAPEARPGARRRRRVLVVDDDALVGRALARLLAGEHDVEVLTSALEAARRVEEGERWDVVLCDLIMPDLTGMELAARIERGAPDLARRLVFTTGGAYTDGSRAFLASGGRRHLEKPVDADVLRELVRTLGADG